MQLLVAELKNQVSDLVKIQNKYEDILGIEKQI